MDSQVISISHTGINKHEGEDIGLHDTVLGARDCALTFINSAAREQ